MNLIQTIEHEQMQALRAKRVMPEFSPGDSLKVMVKVIEGESVRTQAYEGVCIEFAQKHGKSWAPPRAK